MSAFGLITIMSSGNLDGKTEHYEHFVSQDAALREWLLNTDYKPSQNEGFYIVQLPEGYVLHNCYLKKSEAESIGTDSVSNVIEVSKYSPQEEKAQFLLDVLTFTKPEAFHALDLPDEAVLEMSIYETMNSNSISNPDMKMVPLVVTGVAAVLSISLYALLRTKRA